MESVVQSIPILLNGEERALRFTFLAFNKLGVNPFEENAIAKALEPLDIPKAAKFVWAGLLHEKRKESEEDIMEMLDMGQFLAILAAIRAAGGEQKEAVNGEASGPRPIAA